ncbi:SDR family oxidoreductase [Silanimonas sp.]|uniref:SDR family oxidoreductase n=1 Tax=Silanimonas sp. TaxID=1929290 RepID=UPI0022BB28A5|nr:SDR family oxidoreductase [Silanimonas sp.]MCZ8115491.1 SDR family oxidoreductase [Silanimonas sp.]
MRTAVVTGGASSVGLAIARRFLADGYTVWVCDVDEGAIATVTGTDPELSCRVVDLLDPLRVERFFAEVTRATGAVDILVNTVGLSGPTAAVEDVGYGDWDTTLRGSAGAAFYCIKQVAARMKQRRSGSIVNFSSCSAKTALPMRTPYVAAKWALEGLTLSLARELGPYNVRVNAIRPGAIDNDRLKRILAASAAEAGVTPAEFERQALAYVSMRSKIEINELVAAVTFLTSDSAPHITGQIIAVDGNVEWER